MATSPACVPSTLTFSPSSLLFLSFSQTRFGVNSEAEVMDMLTALPSFSPSHLPFLFSSPPLFPPPVDKGLTSS